MAALAAATAGTVLVGELARLAKRRALAAPSEPETVLETAEYAIAATREATQDAVAVAIEGYESASREETILFNMLGGFIGAFAVVRLSTHGIRGGWWPTRNLLVKGRHIHHFVPGILIAFASGGAAILTEGDKLEERLAIPFGVGVGLTFDEAALLLDLRDVYWTPEGVFSVQASFGVSALLGATILGLRMLRRGEQMTEERGVIPAPTGEMAIITEVPKGYSPA